MERHWDEAVLKGLVRMARPEGPLGLRTGIIPGVQPCLSPRAAEGAKGLLAEAVVTVFMASGGGGASPFPNPYGESEVVRVPAWRRWKLEDLGFSFGSASLRIAANSFGAPSLPDAREPWHTGDALLAWRCLSQAPEAEVARWARAGCPEAAWLVLGFPAIPLSPAHRLDRDWLFRAPLLPLVESLMPWSETMWRKVLANWFSLGTEGRRSVLGGWNAWRDLCLLAGRPDLVRGMVMGAFGACCHTRWLDALRDRAPAVGAVPFSELEAWEADYLSVGDMLAGMAECRDRAEELVYIDETYASALAFKEAVPAAARDGLVAAAREVRAMRALVRGTEA